MRAAAGNMAARRINPYAGRQAFLLLYFRSRLIASEDGSCGISAPYGAWFREKGGKQKGKAEGDFSFLEVTTRFELVNDGFADRCLTTWLRHHMKSGTVTTVPDLFGAGDEARTRYLHLGKVALYRMSYTREWCLRPELNWRHADFQSAALPTELPRRIKSQAKRLGSWVGDPEQTRTVDLQRDRLAC